MVSSQVGEDVTFHLLRRSRTSFIPLPAAPDHGKGDGYTRAHTNAWPHLSAEAASKDAQAWDTANISYERHSKFTLISDPLPLWCNTVEQLAKTAVQVRA